MSTSGVAHHKMDPDIRSLNFCLSNEFLCNMKSKLNVNTQWTTFVSVSSEIKVLYHIMVNSTSKVKHSTLYF